MSGGKSSQRKGRGGEREARDILNAAGFSARCMGIYECHDIACDFGDGREVPGEVKRRRDGMNPAYMAFDNGAQFLLHRSDRKEWLIVFSLEEFVRRYGPELAAPPLRAPFTEDGAGLIAAQEEAASNSKEKNKTPNLEITPSGLDFIARNKGEAA